MNIVDFKAKNSTERVQELANSLPNGELWRAKNIPGSTFYKLLESLSLEFHRLDGEAYGLAESFIINEQTTEVLGWEKFVGIPDQCFNLNFSEIQRRINVLIKLGYLNLQQNVDYFELGLQLNVIVQEVDDFTSPGTIIITVLDLAPDNVFNMDFSAFYDPVYGAFLFGSRTGALYECLVREYRPIFYDVQFIFVDPI